MHTLAAYFPERPTTAEREAATSFLHVLGGLYPCGHCAEDFRTSLDESPPRCPPCRHALARCPWQHWLAWRALCLDVRSPQPRQPPAGQSGVLLRALAAGHALVRRPRPTRTCRGTADAVSPRCWTGATEASDVAVKRSSRWTFPAPGSSRALQG
eukprot:scaffold103121_cov65-Phaeocystis_antarctica.AAC.6